MAFNGSGTFVRIYNWVNDANASVPITASRMDGEDDGFATGLSTCLTKDGQTTPTANLPMGGYKHTNVADATARNGYASAGQVQDSGLLYGGTAGGTANALTIALSPAITAYATGQTFRFLSASPNTAATTINVNGVGAKNVFKNGAACQGGEIQASKVYEVYYDGTQFQLTAITADYVTYNVQTGTTYTIVAADFGKIITLNNASAITVTFPQQSTTALPAGFWCIIRQIGAGQVTLAKQGSDTINSIGSATKLRAQYSQATIDLQTAGSPNTIAFFGDISS